MASYILRANAIFARFCCRNLCSFSTIFLGWNRGLVLSHNLLNWCNLILNCTKIGGISKWLPPSLRSPVRLIPLIGRAVSPSFIISTMIHSELGTRNCCKHDFPMQMSTISQQSCRKLYWKGKILDRRSPGRAGFSDKDVFSISQNSRFRHHSCRL